jgi:hypothetical protein
MSDEIVEILSYMCEKTNRKLVVDPNISLITKPSTLPSEFIVDSNKGLFTTKLITKGTIIMKMEGKSMMNDGMVNLESILHANTSEECYQAWSNMKKSYYNIEKAKQVVNVRMLADRDGDSYYEAIQDISPNSELLRIYGFTTWIFELLHIITNKNVFGFAQFINDLSSNITGDPYEDRIKRLQSAFLKCSINNIYTIDRNEYDESMKDEPIKNIGSVIQFLYLLDLYAMH